MCKKLIRTLAASLAICSMLVAPAYAETAVVTGNSVNMRAGPGTFYYVVTTLSRNTPVTVTDRSNGNWYAVEVGGETGFISSSYLSLDGSGAVTTPAFTPEFAPADTVTPDSSLSYTPAVEATDAYINAMYVRFRSGPGSEYSVLGEYNRGKTVRTIGSGDGWTACVIDGQLGYIYSQYITTGSLPTQSTGSNNSSGSGFTAPDFTPAATVAPGFGIPQPNEGTLTPDVTFTPAATVTPIATATPAPILPSPSATEAPVLTPIPTAAPAPVQTPSASAGKSGYINGTYVRFRSGPGTNHSILGTYHTGKTVAVTADAGNGWYQCVIDGVLGYVNASYVIVMDQASFGGLTVGGGSGASGTISGTTQVTPAPAETPTPTVEPTPTPTPTPVQYTEAYIIGNNVRFRSSPSMTAAILGEFFYGNTVKLVASQNGWAQVIAENGQTGYVYASYVREGSYSAGNESSGTDVDNSASNGGATQTPSSSAAGQDIANYACQFVGYNYRWGGTSPDTGFDCSGLVQYVYKQFGYTLNRVAADQAKNGRHVEPSELTPGDILCFYSGSSYIGHVGIYIGNGQFVHASNSTTGVIISSLAGYYVSRGYEARRIIG